MKRPIVIVLLTVALTLVCLGIGAVVLFTFNNGFPTNNPFISQDVSSVLEESKTLKVDTESPVILNVMNDLGKVTIIGADVTTVQIDVIKTAYDSTLEKADQEVKAIKYSIEQNDNTIGVKYEVPNLNDFSEYNTVDFFITVPNQTSTNIEANFGDVTAKNIEGELTVQSNSGEINIEAVDAGDKNIDINTEFGDITLEQIKANDVSVTSNSGVVTFTNVRAAGDAYIKTDFGSTVYKNGSAASLTLDTNSGKISISKINVTKELKVQNDFGDIELTQAIAGSYDLQTNSGAITVDGTKGKLKAYTDFGNIEISNAKSVTLDIKTNSGTIEFSGSLGAGPHKVESEFGNIDLALPTDAKLNVDLKTDFGKIRSDLPITVTLTESSSSEKDQVAGSINGGGEELIVSTNSGGINITAIK